MAQEQFFFPEVPVILAAGEGVSRTKLFGTDAGSGGRVLSVRRSGGDHPVLYGGGGKSWDSKTIQSRL